MERDVPGARIGPEPTTDRFTAIMHGPERIIPGNAVAVSVGTRSLVWIALIPRVVVVVVLVQAATDKPFTALQKFGMNFLNRFESAA